MVRAIARNLAADATRIVITGAGGWIGLAALDLLEQALGGALEERVRCFGSSERELVLRSGRRVAQHRIDALAELDRRPTFLLHLAFLTKDRAESMSEEAYVEANRMLSAKVLAALEPIGVTGLFVASSGAAALADDGSRAPAMRLYGALKRAEEETFAAWAATCGASLAIARIYNLAGPYINKPENYALASFIVDALADRPIVIRAPRRVVRGYVAIDDLLCLIFSILLQREPEAVRFETGGSPVEIEDVARLVSGELGEVPIERAPITDSADDIYLGDDEAWRRLLSRHGIRSTPLDEQVRQTIQYLATASEAPLSNEKGVVRG